LEATGLYVETAERWQFISPKSGKTDQCRLAPLWHAAEKHLKTNANRAVAISELYDLWRRPPLGVKDGLMPVLAVAFILSKRETVAFYREGIFQARFRDLDVEYLAKDPADIQLRWMDLPDVSRRLLSGMAEIVRAIDGANALTHLEPIDVARGLVAIFEQLPAWTKRTMRLSANAVRIRTLFKQAIDPNKFLFDDIPAAFGRDVMLRDEAAILQLIAAVRDGLEELTHAYPTMLWRLRDHLLAELQVPNASPQALAELRDRAENIKELAGDFRLEAVIGRLASFNGTAEEIEGIASLAVDKPLRDWVDQDVDRAALEVTAFAQKFIRCEAFARVKGRRDKRHSMAVVVGIGGRPTPILEEFDLPDADRQAVDSLMSNVTNALNEADQQRRHIILAALAELSAHYMQIGPRAAMAAAEGPRKRSTP
jgi:hypothetical protein